MIFKYPVLLRARYGGPFVLFENARLPFIVYAEMTLPTHFTLFFSAPTRNMS